MAWCCHRWENRLSSNVTVLSSECSRIAGVQLSISRKSFLIISFYAPTSGQDEEFLESICSLSEFLRINYTLDCQIVIGADSNCSTGSSQHRQKAWLDFCHHHNLVIRETMDPTFHHHNGLSNSFLDVFVVSNSCDTGPLSQICTLDEPLNLSSHDPIVTTIQIKANLNEPTQQPRSYPYTSFNRKKIIWDESKLNAYQCLTAETLSKTLGLLDQPECIPLVSSLVPQLLVKSALKVFDVLPLKSTATPSLI